MGDGMFMSGSSEKVAYPGYTYPGYGGHIPDMHIQDMAISLHIPGYGRHILDRHIQDMAISQDMNRPFPGYTCSAISQFVIQDIGEDVGL